MLSKIFNMQKELNIMVNADTNGGTLEDREKLFFQYAFALSQEASELLDCSDWKWWSKVVKENPDKQFRAIADFENAKIEAIDILFFLTSIFQILGMTPEDVLKIYEMKWKVNVDRQKADYDIRFKTEDDNNRIKEEIKKSNRTTFVD